jgi:hypothetical protein
MKQDIIPYSQLRRHRVRSNRPIATRTISVVSVNQPTTAEAVQVVEIDTYTWEPAPMTRPIEALTSEEKVAALERALSLARMEWKIERRKHRSLRRRFLIQG